MRKVTLIRCAAQDVTGGLVKGQAGEKGTSRNREKTGPLDDMRGSIRASQHLLLSKEHKQNRLGSLGEGGRAERPLKIRNGHVERAQAKPGPGQQQKGKTGTCFGRQEREPYHGDAHPSPRAPAVTVATTRFFLSAQCAPRADNTVELVGVYLACPLGSQGAQVPA